jgi:ATP synthase protein I
MREIICGASCGPYNSLRRPASVQTHLYVLVTVVFLPIINGFAELGTPASHCFCMPDMIDMHPDDEAPESDFKPLTPDEARVLRAKYPPLSPLRVILWQILLGVLVVVVVWGVTGRTSLAMSALYGAAVVVVPTLLFARGLMGRGVAGGPSAALLRFFGWEAVKIVVALAMMVAAPRVVAGLSWLTLVVSMVLVMKAYWIAFWWQSRTNVTNN